MSHAVAPSPDSRSSVSTASKYVAVEYLRQITAVYSEPPTSSLINQDTNTRQLRFIPKCCASRYGIVPSRIGPQNLVIACLGVAVEIFCHIHAIVYPFTLGSYFCCSFENALIECSRAGFSTASALLLQDKRRQSTICLVGNAKTDVKVVCRWIVR
jgi:hypothetical protein